MRKTTITRAVIPVAGLGTRLRPATYAVPKPLLPVADNNGNVKPIIHILVSDAAAAGISDLALIVSPDNVSNFQEYFQATSNILPDISISFIVQEQAKGFGHAVFQAREWVNEEPFLLMLGDHLYRDGTKCIRKLLSSFAQTGTTTFGMVRFPVAESAKRGCLAGVPTHNQKDLYHLTQIQEKPTPDVARSMLRSPGLDKETVFALFGCYAFSPFIFEILEKSVRQNILHGGEIQLTHAMEELKDTQGCMGRDLNGTSLDIGNPSDYIRAFNYLSE